MTKIKTGKMFKFETASTDKNYHFYISLGGFKCGVRLMLDRVKLVNEPDNPRFLRPFERAIKNLKSSKERIKKFTLVTPVNVDEKPFKTLLLILSLRCRKLILPKNRRLAESAYKFRVLWRLWIKVDIVFVFDIMLL